MNNPLSMEQILAGVKQEGHNKTAAAASRGMTQEDAAYAEELALLDKVANGMDQNELLKIAASAKLTGEIMGDIQLEKFAAQLPGMLLEKLAVPIVQLVQAAVVDVMRKLAVGDSEVITGHTKEIEPDGNPQEAALIKDQVGKNEEPVGARNLANAERTEGAQAAGGDPKSHQGEHTMANPEGDTVHKLSRANAQLQRLLARAGVKQAMGDMAGGGMGGYGAGDMGEMGGPGGQEAGPEAILQQLLAKQAAGQPLSPEEQQLLDQLMGGAGGGGGMPPGGGGPDMVREASYADPARVQGVEAFLRQRLLG